jgi:pyridoxal phosphate enzyme (YggS family)
VSKTKPAEAVRDLALAGQRAFGENYVQEALAKIEALAGRGLEWHLIGRLQSNKCRDVAGRFDWVQSLDRPKLVEELARHRAPSAPPLNILVQVNPDGEAGKSGCEPAQIDELADLVAAAPRLRLRGLMAIPEPSPDMAVRRRTFARMAEYFSALQARHAGVDTLSMGMSEDFELAIAEGATMIRVGTALFGPRG